VATTAQNVITDAFLTLGVFQPGDSVPAPDANFALIRLGGLQEQWKLQPLTAVVNTREVFTLTSGKGGPGNPYTIGPTGNLVTTRPASVSEIHGCGLLLGGSSPAIEIPRALLTDDGYEAIQVKDLANPLFTDVYYNPTYASDLGTINLWPVPNTALHSLVLYRMLPIGLFPSLTASQDLPTAAFRALSDGLAEELATPYGRADLLPVVGSRALNSLAIFKRMNTELTDLPQDPAVTHDQRGGYNILTGSGG